MIQLTTINFATLEAAGTILISPEKISDVISAPYYTSTGASLDTTLVTLGQDNIIRVLETPMDVARLRAAWERRYGAFHEEIAEGELPIAAMMTSEGISMTFCEYTHAHVLAGIAAAEAERAAAEAAATYDPAKV